ncbi:multiheme c-type cytochrome [Sandarakinorhabdus sp. DWP1-3-1]|uniref:multiheme c-type cytochrome n=1 Tax=Sandarakinorhabdus sp. DWP1-3-1 TaxID=2804627 RepID=UPI003CEBF535
MAGADNQFIRQSLFALVALLLIAAAPDPAIHENVHQGVVSCGGSTCHGRQEATGPRVRQNELLTWQDPASLAGAHARAWKVLQQPRARAIGARLGIADVAHSPECTACHGDPAPRRGPQWRQADGVGCEACHGGAGSTSAGWLASHAAVGATHTANVARGLWAIDRPAVRANLCLDCHFGSSNTGQFVGHRIMAAGHPRLAFELDLFTSLQSHHDEDADYAARKPVAGGVRVWAVGQALAVGRALALYPARSAGSFPEFTFFDCRSCHRTFSDDPAVPLLARSNPGRPIPPGQPVWNDESLITLQAAARVAAPALARQLDSRSRAFHASLAGDRAGALRAAADLGRTAAALAAAFETSRFDKAQTLAMLDAVLVGSAGAYTDYQGGAQAVMAADTLLSALVSGRHIDRAAADAIRPDLDRAYAAARDANRWQPAVFRSALAGVATRVRALQ